MLNCCQIEVLALDACTSGAESGAEKSSSHAMADMRRPYLTVVWVFLFDHFRGEVIRCSDPALRSTLKLLVLGQPKVAELDQWPGATV